jgi:hypothetical protein
VIHQYVDFEPQNAADFRLKGLSSAVAIHVPTLEIAVFQG